jgi:TnpA family transposase
MVDDHGFTDQLFGLCHLRGYTLMPRLPVHKQQLYKLDPTKNYSRLDEVMHGTGDMALIQEQWDQLVRVGASLRQDRPRTGIPVRRFSCGLNAVACHSAPWSSVTAPRRVQSGRA